MVSSVSEAMDVEFAMRVLMMTPARMGENMTQSVGLLAGMASIELVLKEAFM